LTDRYATHPGHYGGSGVSSENRQILAIPSGVNQPQAYGDKDRRTGREAALAYTAGEAERFASDPEHESIINHIVEDNMASGDRSGVVTGFFSILAGCSFACWRPEEVERFRRHYEQADREFDEQLAALSRRYARVTSLKPPAA
jgi:hypothetical protein